MGVVVQVTSCDLVVEVEVERDKGEGMGTSLHRVYQ